GWGVGGRGEKPGARVLYGRVPGARGRGGTVPPVLSSVGSAGYGGQHRLDLPAFFRKAARLGYPAVMLAGKRPHLSPLDYPDAASLEPIRRAADEAGGEVTTIAGYTDFTASRHAAELPFVEMHLPYLAPLARI